MKGFLKHFSVYYLIALELGKIILLLLVSCFNLKRYE